MASALYFCDSCADKRVRDVKTELELLFRTEQIDPLKCGICSEVRLKKESVEVKKENQQESLETDKTQESIAKTQSSAEEFDIVDVDLAIFKDADYMPSDVSDEGDTDLNDSDEIEASGDKPKSAKKVDKKECNSKEPKERRVRIRSVLDISEVNPELKDMILEGSITPAQFACKICKKEFKWNAQMMITFSVHIAEHTEQNQALKPFKCPLCTMCFARFHSLKRHIKEHTDPLFYECPHSGCDRKFKQKVSVSKHEELVHGVACKPKPHLCQICGAAFDYANLLQKHQLRHEGVKAFKCSDCDKCFYDKKHLSMHQERHNDANKSVCEVCGKTCPNKRDLKSHRMMHTDERTYQCEYCPYMAKRLGNLRNHIKNIHTESDPNKCKCGVCGLTFLSATACKRHEKKHQSGLDLAEVLLKPHKCPDCGFRASKPCKIRVHMRSHTGEKPYKCDHCQRAFVANGQRKQHMKICKKR